jgi:SAM-dependent methyltransferase
VLYDEIGVGYQMRRVPDPRIAVALRCGLGDASSVVNVGAGTGSYEPRDLQVIAVEPSMTMIGQRAPGAAPALRAVAERLPLRDACVSAAMAVLTIHHWSDWQAGLRELARVARDRVVVLSWDPAGPAFWLTRHYFPSLLERDRRRFPGIAEITRCFAHAEVRDLPIPHDCVDGFLGAYWRRPHAYLDAAVRSGMSGFAGGADEDAGLARLSADLASGTWHRRFGQLLERDVLDIGYRLVVALPH